MSFEKTKEAVEKNDLKLEEDTSTDTGQSEENETDSEEDTSTNESATEEKTEVKEEESVEALKARLAKAEEDRDNYKQGLLVAKSKGRTIEQSKVETEEEEKDIQEEKILSTIYKVNEKKVLRDVIDPKSPQYIPELVDDVNYNEIIGYLPYNLDKSTEGGIVKGLKIAVQGWKTARGITDNETYEKGVKDGKAKAKVSDLSSVGGESSGKAENKAKPAGRKLLKQQDTPHSWYK